MDAGRQSGWQRGKISALNYCFTRAVRGFQHLEDGRCFLLSLHVSDPKGEVRRREEFLQPLVDLDFFAKWGVRLALMNASGLAAWSVYYGSSWTWRSGRARSMHIFEFQHTTKVAGIIKRGFGLGSDSASHLASSPLPRTTIQSWLFLC